jgi:hypothetical protein
MADVQVTCITKPDRNSRHEGITHIGGSGWRWPVSKVIESIRSGTNTFHTVANGRRANIEVVEGPRPYLRTKADGTWTDNLLALPQCSG